MASSVARAILKSFRFAPSTTTLTGMPCASVSTLRFVPRFARSVGLGPVFFPTERGLRHRPIHRYPAPVESNKLVVAVERFRPKLLEHTGLRPLHEPAMRR